MLTLYNWLIGEHNLKKILFSISLLYCTIFLNSFADASNFGFGIHGGYGVVTYEEETSALDVRQQSKASLTTVIFGASGEYTFPQQDHYYAGITTDFTLSAEDNEKLKENSTTARTNNISIFGQYYDLRLGYKNSLDRFYYRVYFSGGWDGIRFKRNDFIENGASVSGTVESDFSLWRAGAGTGIGYKLGDWALDGRAAYSYYFDGKVESSRYDGITFNTNGTCLDLGLGVARKITGNLNFYIGGSYTLIKLDESEVKRNVTVQAGRKEDVVFPDTETQIIVGVMNLIYAF